MYFIKNIPQEINFIKKVRYILNPMMDVHFVQNNSGKWYITKNGITFGIIKDGELFLLNENNNMQKCTNLSEKSKDFILRLATKSYWIARDKIKETP